MKWRRPKHAALYPYNFDLAGVNSHGDRLQWKRRLRLLARGYLPRFNPQRKWTR